VTPGSLVSLARVFLAIFALLAIIADPSQPALNTTLTYYLLSAYALYSVMVWVAVTKWPQTAGLALAIHLVDVTVFVILVFLTEGPTSPLFVLFTFALFSAALSWGWRAVAATAVAIIIAYGYLAASSEFESGEEITRTIVRSAYMVVASILFVYFAAALERERMRYVRLAAWPMGNATNTQFPDLHPVLSHVANVANVQRLLAVWEDAYEPHCFFAELADSTTRYWTESGLDLAETPPHLPLIVSCRDAGSSWPELKWVLERNGIVDALVAPLGAARRGWLFFIRNETTGDEIIPLASVAALRLGAEIDQHHLRLDLLNAAVREGRSKLARDIHDGLLQSLTAVSLQIKSLELELPQQQQQRLVEIRGIILRQQVKLRELVASARPTTFAATVGIGSAVGRCMERLQVEWKCTVSLIDDATDLTLPTEALDGLLLFLTETVANAVRHGNATHIDVHACASTDQLTLRISDNGSGLAGHTGFFDWDTVAKDKLGSASLRQRAVELGASMHLLSAADGLVVNLEVPLE